MVRRKLAEVMESLPQDDGPPSAGNADNEPVQQPGPEEASDSPKARPAPRPPVEAAAAVSTAPPPIPNDAAPTQDAKIKRELREEMRRKELRVKLDDVVASLGLAATDYVMRLYRKSPEWQGQYKVRGFLEKYTQIPTVEEIAGKHGGGVYDPKLSGPHPDDPTRTESWNLPEIEISGNPATYHHNGSAMPLPPDAYTPPPKPTGENNLGVLTDLVRDIIKQSEASIQKRIEEMAPKPPDPEVLKDAREERRQAHELALKRMEQDAVERKRADDQRREDEKQARAEAARERERADAKAADERRQAHERDMALLALKAEADKAEREERARDREIMLKAQADSQRAIAEALEKIGKKKEEDPLDAMQKLAMTFKIMGEAFGPKEEKAPPPPGGLELARTALPRLMDSVDKAVTAFANGGTLPGKKPASRPVARPGTIISSPVRTINAPAVETVQEPAAAPAAPVPDPVFEFPTAETDGAAALKMLGANIDAALRAGWLAQRIFTDVVSKFPTSVRDLVMSVSKDDAISTMASFAPEGSAIKEPLGRMTVGILYSLWQAAVPAATAAPAP